jgi:hypothetical protein
MVTSAVPVSGHLIGEVVAAVRDHHRHRSVT